VGHPNRALVFASEVFDVLKGRGDGHGSDVVLGGGLGRLGVARD
jgi:hypothetical protein